MASSLNSGNNHSSVRTQFLVFTVLGEYILDRGGAIWTRDLLYLMDLLGISERAVRTVLSRMTRRGWVVSAKHGRHSRYSLTNRGRDLLERGKRRIFEPIATHWDGQWHMVIYSLPESNRYERHALRTQLSWLGFGLLAPGTWISPHNQLSELDHTFSKLDIETYVQRFSGSFAGPASDQELVDRCWNLEGLEAQYQLFVDRFLPEYDEFQKKCAAGSDLSPVEWFTRLCWLTYEFQSFPLKDPNLPIVLLPSDWAGVKAYRLFEDYHRLLVERANSFVQSVIQVELDVPVS